MKNKVVSLQYKVISKRILFCLCFAYALLLTPYYLKAAKPVYFKTIQKTPIDLFINTTNDIFLMQKGMLERYYSNGVFSKLWKHLHQRTYRYYKCKWI